MALPFLLRFFQRSLLINITEYRCQMKTYSWSFLETARKFRARTDSKVREMIMNQKNMKLGRSPTFWSLDMQTHHSCPKTVLRLKIPAVNCREAPYCNSLAPLNPFGCAKRNLMGRAKSRSLSGRLRSLCIFRGSEAHGGAWTSIESDEHVKSNTYVCQ